MDYQRKPCHHRHVLHHVHVSLDHPRQHTWSAGTLLVKGAGVDASSLTSAEKWSCPLYRMFKGSEVVPGPGAAYILQDQSDLALRSHTWIARPSQRAQPIIMPGPAQVPGCACSFTHSRTKPRKTGLLARPCKRLGTRRAALHELRLASDMKGYCLGGSRREEASMASSMRLLIMMQPFFLRLWGSSAALPITAVTTVRLKPLGVPPHCATTCAHKTGLDCGHHGNCDQTKCAHAHLHTLSSPHDRTSSAKQSLATPHGASPQTRL